MASSKVFIFWMVSVLTTLLSSLPAAVLLAVSRSFRSRYVIPPAYTPVKIRSALSTPIMTPFRKYLERSLFSSSPPVPSASAGNPLTTSSDLSTDNLSYLFFRFSFPASLMGNIKLTVPGR